MALQLRRCAAAAAICGSGRYGAWQCRRGWPATLGSVGVDGLPQKWRHEPMIRIHYHGNIKFFERGEGRQGGPSNRHDIFRTMRRWKLGALARKLKIIFWAKDKTTVACMRVLRGYPNYMFTNLYMMMMMCSTEKFAKALEKCPSHRCWYLLNLVVFNRSYCDVVSLTWPLGL
jgi:hypothetical protein